MKTSSAIKFIFTAFSINLFLGLSLCAQTVQFPTNISLTKKTNFLNEITKISRFPFYVDNVHVNPQVETVTSGDTYGINLMNKVPKVCLDDFRYGHKFDNTLGENGYGYLSVIYWLPSNGDYLLLDFSLENDNEYYREFFVTTDLKGVIIDYLLVNDGWTGEKGANFIQSTLLSDLTLQQTEIKMLSTSYTPYTDITSFPGQKADYVYKISTEGKFVLKSKNEYPQRTFNITELKGLLKNLPK
jgi:hypothetical protein